MKLPRAWIPLDAVGDFELILREVARLASSERTDARLRDDVIATFPLLDHGVDQLDESPRLSEWLARFDRPWSRARLLRLEPGAHTPACADASRGARERVCVMLPLRGGLLLETADGRVALQAGRPGLVDTWRRHRLANVGPGVAHLVMGELAGLPDATRATNPIAGSGSAPRVRRQQETKRAMDPWELQSAVGFLLGEVATDTAPLQAPLSMLVRIARAAWAAGAEASTPTLARAVDDARSAIVAAGAERVQLRNGLGLLDVLDQQAFAPLRGEPSRRTVRHSPTDPLFDRPVFIVSPPRAGSTLLFETLVRARNAVSIGDESHALIEGLPSLSPAARAFGSNRLEAADAVPGVASALRVRFIDQLRDRSGHRVDGIRRVRMIEKTPKNALRIPFLREVFPEARFLYLHRDPRQVLASMMESWTSGRFVTYPQLPGWSGPPWSLLLVPGWRALAGEPLETIVGAQWESTMRTMLDDLDAVAPDRRLGVDYARLLADPSAELARICAWAGLEWDSPIDGALPLSRFTVSAPGAEKWRRHEAAIERQLRGRQDLVKRAAAAA